MARIEIVLYVANKRLNELMRGFDLCPPHKVFVTPKAAGLETTAEITDDYFAAMIEKSRANEDWWIPAIHHAGKLHKAPEIKVMSDGNHEMFVGNKP